eukprot:s3124_g5.t1
MQAGSDKRRSIFPVAYVVPLWARNCIDEPGESLMLDATSIHSLCAKKLTSEPSGPREAGGQEKIALAP